MKIRILFLMTLIAITSIPVFASGFRVAQLPNGTKFGCANCHVSPNGGGARNKFGQLVEAKYLSNIGNVLWGAAIAAEDADGDGQSNGKELQDQNGLWKTGQANPGDFSKVTNPGDVNSTDIFDTQLPSQFALLDNYPNPFNPTTQIGFQIPEASFVSLKVFDAAGREAATLVNEYLEPGAYNTQFSAQNSSSGNSSIPLTSGVYFYILRAGGYEQTKKMLMIK